MGGVSTRDNENQSYLTHDFVERELLLQRLHTLKLSRVNAMAAAIWTGRSIITILSVWQT